MHTQIRFLKPCWNSQRGNLPAGALLRCGAEEAQHFVEMAGAAEYVVPAEPADQPADLPVAEQAPEPLPIPAKRSRRQAAADAGNADAAEASPGTLL